VLGVLVAGASAAPAAESGGPQAGVLYAAKKGGGTLRLVRIGTNPEGRPLVLVEPAPKCDVFRPAARVVLAVGPADRFKGKVRAFDQHTTDSVDATIAVSGTVGASKASLELAIELEAEDNGGPTGSCDRTQRWTLKARADAGAARVSGAAKVPGDRIAVGRDAIFVGDDDEQSPRVRRVDPTTLAVAWTVTPPGRIAALAAFGDAVWVLDDDLAELTRLDAATGQVVARIPLETPQVAKQRSPVFTSLSAGERGVWVSIDTTNRVYRVDPATNTVAARGTLTDEPRAVLATATGALVGTSGTTGAAVGRLVQLDATTTVVTAAPLPGRSLGSLALHGTDLWVLTTEGLLVRYSAATLTTLSDGLELPRGTGVGVSAIAGAPPGVWIATEDGIAAYSGSATVVTVPVVGGWSSTSAAGFGAVWVLDAGYLVRIDAR
jgi:hypothetical protein